MRAAHFGIEYDGGEANEILLEYIKRKRLAGLGVTITGDQIPAFLCDAFLIIERAIEDAQDDERKRKNPRRK